MEETNNKEPRAFPRDKAKKLAKRVKFCHFNVEANGCDPGAATVAITDDGENVYYGISLCSPLDNFNRREGRGRALRRLFTGDKLWGSFPVGDAERLSERFQMALWNCLDDEREYFRYAAANFPETTTVPWYVPVSDFGDVGTGTSKIAFRKPRKEKKYNAK